MAQVEAFDYSGLCAELAVLSKPAQRALIGEGIFKVEDLSLRTVKQISALHGMGPASMPALRDALRKNKLAFAESR